MKCLSLDHHKAGVAVRRRFAFSSAQRAALEAAFAGGGVALVTCHRTELYFNGEREEAERVLSCGGAPFLYYEEGEAERHLFRLAAGLCSMLVGEDEILGQLRGAYEAARLSGHTRGLDAAFQAALACGKRVRSETKISSYACSLATLAADAVFRCKDGEKRALLVGGTGKIGAALLKNLLAGGVRVTATFRRRGAFAAAEGAAGVPYEARYACVAEADAVLSCTASPHTVFEAEKLAPYCADGKKRLFIDLALPPDIDERVGAWENCTLLGIDGFAAAAAENNRKKAAAAVQAEDIVSACLAEYFAAECAKKYAPYLEKLDERERRALYALRKSDPAAFIARCRDEGGQG